MDPLKFPLRAPDQPPPAVVEEQQQRVDDLRARIQEAVQQIAALKALREQFVQSGDKLQFQQRDFQAILAQFEAREKEFDEAVDDLDPADVDVQAKFAQFSKELQIAWQLFKQLQDAESVSKLAAQLKAQQELRAKVALRVAEMEAAIASDSEEVDAQEEHVGTAEHHTHALSQSASKAARAVIAKGSGSDEDD